MMLPHIASRAVASVRLSPMQQRGSAYGVWFAVCCDDEALSRRLLERVPPGTRLREASSGEVAFTCSVSTDQPSPAADALRVVSLDGVELQRSYDDAPALEVFESTVRFEVVRRARRWTFVHAGVVGWHGVAIVIPGVSRSGKSTLVKALVEAGATYYSDEYAAFDSRGRVFPFAQPLMARLENGDRERLSVSDLGGVVGTAPLPVGLVVSTRFQPESAWNPVNLSPGDAVLAMMANTVRAQADPARSLRVLSRVAERADAIASDRGDVATVASEILKRAEGSRSLMRSSA